MSTGLRVAAIEVTQAVQDLNNSVPLVAGKPAVVRVFIGGSPPQVTTAGGLLKIKHLSSGATGFLDPVNELRLDPADQRTLGERRLDLNGSLNFLIPADATLEGEWRITALPIVDAPNTGMDRESIKIHFVVVPPLRLKVIGFRYALPSHPTEHEPRDADYALLESWLKRAFPISELQFKRIVSSPSDFDSYADSTYIHSKLQVTRNNDLDSGGDPRVRYYGMIPDAHRIRGQTRLEKDRPGPDALSCGPTGVPGPEKYSWDTDGSYGDWYAAHELGHGLGRGHPGACQNQPVDDPYYPHKNGKISDSAEGFVGFDIGDPAQGLEMRVYPGTVYHDVMTYCPYLWISAYTYAGIMKQLQIEEL